MWCDDKQMEGQASGMMGGFGRPGGMTPPEGMEVPEGNAQELTAEFQINDGGNMFSGIKFVE